jgi:hypothetical protein
MIKNNIIIEIKKTNLVFKETKGDINKTDNIIKNPSSKSTNCGKNKIQEVTNNTVTQNMHANEAYLLLKFLDSTLFFINAIHVKT